MIGLANADVCDLNEIYCQEFKYSLPRPVLESFLDGKAFDHKESYTAEEKECLANDIRSIYDSLNFGSSGRLGDPPLAVITAGAPGAGKTVLMLHDLQMCHRKAAYVDPDDVSLKKMKTTYQAELRDKTAALNGKIVDPEERISAERRLRQELYDKWRPASNGIHHILAAHVIRSKSDFYFGSCLSSPASAFFLRFLKEQGYRIKLLHLMAPDSVRWGSVKERDKVFVQTTEQDIVEKGFLVPQRILDTYLKFADEIEFYYRGDVKESAVLAAVWTRERQPRLTVLHREAYESIKKIHNAVCEILNRSDLLWESAVEKNCSINFVDERDIRGNRDLSGLDWGRVSGFGEGSRAEMRGIDLRLVQGNR